MKGIYKIESPSGKIYIGQSVNIKRRWIFYTGQHFKHHTSAVIESIKKYGPQEHKFSVVILLPKDATSEVLTKMETAVINFYKEAGFEMLNTIAPGEFTAERAAKISESHKGQKKGFKHSAESIAKMQRSQKAAHQRTGKRKTIRTELQKQKTSKTLLDKYKDPEKRKVISQYMTEWWRKRKLTNGN